MLARLMFAMVAFNARKGLTETAAESSDSNRADSAKERARRTGVRGETYAYWYLRRHGYVLAAPESAVNIEKRRNISRVAQQFLRARHIESAECRFDVLAIETRAGQKPSVRLPKGAFIAGV